MRSQSELIQEIGKLLSHDGRIDTSLSVVFLKGQRAYKIKREMQNGFLDYSTVEKRKALCEREFLINKKISPELYNGVISVSRCGNGDLKLWDGDGLPPGNPEEYLLEMNRFEEGSLLSRLALKGMLTEELCRSLAVKVTELHKVAVKVDVDDYAGRFLNVVKIINEQFRESARGIVPDDALDLVPQKLLGAYDNCRSVLAARGRGGYIRECHGDLHLGNICLFNGAPCVFDAVEFNTEFTHIDTLYDLSFLIMDLHHHGRHDLAEQVSGAYLVGTGTDMNDYLAVMPLYLGLRSIIRCSISAASLVKNNSETVAAGLRNETKKYLQETFTFLV